MQNKVLRQSRRKFLDFIAKTGITSQAIKGSSLLAGLMANRFAQANSGVKRVVFVYTPLGVPNGLWLPNGNQLNAATRAFEGLQSVCHFHETQIVGGGFGHIWKTLAEMRWTDDWTSNTIDHQIATVLSTTTPFSTLHFGVQTKFDSFSRKFLRFMQPMENPEQTYAALFGGEDGKLPDHFGKNSLKENIFDNHLEALNCARAQLSSDERTTIEQYEDSLNALKSKLTPINLQACYQPEWNRSGFNITHPESGGRPAFAEEAYLQSEIISHAFACGLTNVATLQLGDDQGSFIPHDTEFRGDMHQATCGTILPTAYVEVVNYLSRCIAYLIRQLAQQDDPAVPGTKLLDNTVVVHTSSQGDGPAHSGERGPFLIATRMPRFRTGISTPNKGTHLIALQTVAAGLGLEEFIGNESHHCIWPCGKGIDADFLT